MAGVSTARNKANEKAFRSEIMQFVNALEMYKNDNGKYPFESTLSQRYAYQAFNNPQKTPIETIGSGLPALMSKYMKILPNPRGKDDNEAWIFFVNTDVLGAQKFRCTGDIRIPKYIIVISDYFWGSNFSDWPTYESSSDEFVTVITPSSNTHCFSLK